MASGLQVDYLCHYQSLKACKQVDVLISAILTSLLDGMSGQLHDRPVYPGGKPSANPCKAGFGGRWGGKAQLFQML